MSDSRADLRIGFDDPDLEALHRASWEANDLERAIDEVLADEQRTRATSRSAGIGAALARLFVAALLVCAGLVILGVAVRLVAWAWGQ